MWKNKHQHISSLRMSQLTFLHCLQLFLKLRTFFFKFHFYFILECLSGNFPISSCGASLVAQMVKNPPAMQETQVQSPGQKDPLEKGMTTHSRILAWRIPWIGETDRLQSMGSQRVKHDWATNTHTQYIWFTMLYWFQVYSKVYTYTNIHFFQVLFPYRLLHNTEQSSLCCILSPGSLGMFNLSLS